MKKILWLVWLMLAGLLNVRAQYWEPLGGGVSGQFGASVRNLTVDTFHNYLWVSETFDMAGDIEAHNLAIWDGTKWKALEVEPGPVAATVMKHDTLVYACGAIGSFEVGMYVDTVFIGYLDNLSVDVECLYVYEDTLLAGGYFSGGIKYWNGSHWKIFQGGVSGDSYRVESIGEYNGKLVVGSHFGYAGGIPVNNIATWDGYQWSPIGTGITGNSPDIRAIQEFNGELYVGGDFEYAGSKFVDGLAKWTGTEWDTAEKYGCGDIYDIYLDDSILYFAGTSLGTFDYCVGDRIGSFDGVNWKNLFYANGNYAFAVTVFNGQVIGGGNVKYGLNGDTLNYVARFLGYPVSTEQQHQITSSIFPNPTSSTIRIQLTFSHSTALSIINLLGEKMKEEKVSGSDLTIDVSELPPGLYFVRANETAVGKFVKE